MAEHTVVSAADLVSGRDYPIDLAEERSWFGSDDACRDYLEWLRWPGGFSCPHCGAAASSRDGVRYRCGGCRRRVSVTAGTIFDKTRTPLTVWFEAAWLMATGKSGVSAAYLHRVLPISSYQTAWAMLARLRAVMSGADGGLLSGRVEVDETFVGGPRPGKAGRGADGKVLVVGAIEIAAHGWGRARLAVAADASAGSLRAFIRAHVAVGSTVVTDAWKGYPPALSGYTHEPLNVSASGRPAHESLPAVHRLFALVKRTLEGTYQGATGVDHLDEYLGEFVFRFNRRHSRSRGLVFMRLLQRSVAGDPATYRSLVRASQPKAVRPAGVAGSRSQPGTLDIAPTGRPWRQAR